MRILDRRVLEDSRLEKWANKNTLFDHGEVPRRFNRFLPTKKIKAFKGTELLLIDYHAGD